MKSGHHKYLSSFYSGGIWASGFFLTVLIVLLILYVFCDCSLLKNYILIDSVLDNVDQTAISTLINKNKIVPASDIVSHLTSFYSTIITIMGIIIGLVGIFGYIHIKVLTTEGLEKYKDEAKKDAASEVKNYLEKHDFYKVVKEYVTDSLEGTDVDEINQKIARLENDIEVLRNSSNNPPMTTIPRTVSSSLELTGGDKNGNN